MLLKIPHLFRRRHWGILRVGRQWAILVFLVLLLSGCIRREGRNSDCQWPHRPEASVNQSDLRADLEFAEDLATRYMDAHFGPRDQAAAAQAKNRCMGILLAEIGKERGITAEEAFRSFGKRSVAVDFAMNLPFLLLYLLAADFFIRRLLGRYPPREGWVTVTILIILASAVFAGIGVLLAQPWSEFAEAIRIGTQHLSNRLLRLPIRQHPGGAFLLGMALFLGIAVLRFWGKRNGGREPDLP